MRSGDGVYRLLWPARSSRVVEKPLGCSGALVSKAVLTGTLEVYGTEEPTG